MVPILSYLEVDNFVNYTSVNWGGGMELET